MKGVKFDENIVEEALNHTGFGWFNIKVYIVIVLIIINVAHSMGNIGLILSAVVCDFRLSTVSQSYIAIMPMLGLEFGQYLWVLFTEMKGRRKCLIASLCLHGLSEGIASIVPDFHGLLFCKFMNGVAMCGQLMILFTYLGEFQPSKYRNQLLSSLEISWGLGLTLAAGLGWAVIPLNINLYISPNFDFHSWNLYLLLCSLLSPIIAFWLCFLPETPKYLADNGHNRELIELLGRMYHVNTGRPAAEFLQQIGKLENKQFYNLLTHAEDINIPERSFIQTMKKLFNLTTEILQSPYLRTTVILAVSAYGIMFTYFTTSLWLPEVFERIETAEENFFNSTNSICTSFHKFNPLNTTDKDTNKPFTTNCLSKLNSKIYLENLVLGIAIVPLAFVVSLCVSRFGIKLHIIICSLSSSFFGFIRLIAYNSIQSITFFYLCTLLSAVTVALILSIIVDLFPTHLRIVASAFTNSFGRLGGIIGSYLFGYLINGHCQITIGIIAFHIGVAGLLALFLPNVGINRIQLKENQPKNDTKKSSQFAVDNNSNIS